MNAAGRDAAERVEQGRALRRSPRAGRWIRRRRLVALVTAGLSAWAAGAGAQAIFVENAGFETPSLSPNGFTAGVLPGWTWVSGNGDFGAFHPTVPSWGYVAPEGSQLFYTNGALVEQTTAAVAVAGQGYVLAVDVVNRPVYGSLDYVVELRAGAALLAGDYGSLAPPVGGALTSILSVTVAPGSPAVGQPLQIRLGGATQVNFDDVRLLPEPGIASGLVTVAALAASGRRRPPMRRADRA